MGRTTQATTTAAGIAAALASFALVGSNPWFGPVTTALPPTPVTAPPSSAPATAAPQAAHTAVERLGPARLLALPPVPTDVALAPPAVATVVAVETPGPHGPQTPAQTPAPDLPPAPAPPPDEAESAPSTGAPPEGPATDPTPPEPQPERTTAAAEPEAHPSDRAPGRSGTAPGRTKNAPPSASDERGAQARLPLTDSARHTAGSHGPTHQPPAHPERHRPG